MNYAEIIDGFERALELERELGVRSVECDRELVKIAANVDAVVPTASNKVSVVPVDAVVPTASNKEDNILPETRLRQSRPRGGAESVVSRPADPELPLVFLHHAALSAGGVEMMAKIITALKLTAEQAPIVFTGELPAAKKYIVLGGKALAQWFPNRHSAPGNSFEHEGHEVYVTYSPEYILKFKIVTPAVKQLKLEMWNGIKKTIPYMI